MNPGVNIILFIDNHREFLDVRAEKLELAGFDVIKAYTLAEAQHALENEYIHLAVVDIRMVDDDDERDTSGLALAIEEKYRSIPKIILTGHPTIDNVREAMRARYDGQRTAYDVLLKSDGPEAMIQSIQRIIHHQIGISWELMIRWLERSPISFQHMLSLMYLEEYPKNLSRAHRELEDLIRKLFSKYQQIAFSQLLWQKSGRIALKVFAFKRDKMDQFIIKLGRKELIHSAYQSFEEAAKLAIGPVRTSRAFGTETLHFAAEAWILDGTDLEETHTLTEYYRRSSQKGVRSAFESLCQITLTPWVFFDPDKAETKIPINIYHKMMGTREDTFSPEVLRQKIASLVDEKTSQGMIAVKFTDNRLIFHFVSKTTIDPLEIEECPHPADLLLVDHWPAQRRVPVQPTLTSLSVDEVLVDINGHTWLSDIFQVGVAPRFYPFLMLENQVRFDLLEVNSLRRRYDLEKSLLATESLEESIPPADVESDSRKALIAIQAIRQAASRIYGDDRIAYYSGLLFFTMKRLENYSPAIRYTKMEVISFLHCFLLAALLCQKTEALQKAPDQGAVKNKDGKLVVNDITGEVVIGSRRINLSPLEYNILLYLYERAGQLCQREDIVRHVWGIKEPKKKDVNSLLNSHLNRMREEIEPQRSKPKYICTSRGKGIILNLEPG